MKTKKHIAILGGGPSGLFMFKALIDANQPDIRIDIFEKKQQLGVGMPYSHDGANDEHITNVSGNEIPELVTPISEWITTVHKDTLDKYNIDPAKFNDYKVLPRLLFGQYLSAQFSLLQKKAKEAGLEFKVHYNSVITDVTDYPAQGMVEVQINDADKFQFDQVVVCTGHNWPHKNEGKTPGYFDSPYPPSKIALTVDHPVAVRGSSLTAVDALRTLGRHNGKFDKDEKGKVIYVPESEGFRIVMHSRNGLLPAVRFHLEDSHLENSALLTDEEIAAHIAENKGFLSLDYIFEKDFKEIFKEKDPEFYAKVKDMEMEDFVDWIMTQRESQDPFELMRKEYAEAEQSIKKRESIYWKEMLGVLSFAMNYPAKHFSAEDMQRLQKKLSPLISVVIAYVPQSSCDEMLAMHDAGVLDMISVGEDSTVEPADTGAIYTYIDGEGKKQSTHYKTFVDSIGQPHLPFEDLPYKSLIDNRTVTPGRLQFKDAAAGAEAMEKDAKKVTTDGKGNYYLQVPGIAINDSFQVVDEYGALNERIYMMAVPYIGGYNPDYSGLDFCDEASGTIAESMFLNA